jgi:hypothetical protein
MGGGSNIEAEPCGLSREGHQLTSLNDGSGLCGDFTPPSPEEQKIIDAKEALASDYAALKAGKPSQAQVDKAREEYKTALGVGEIPTPRGPSEGDAPSLAAAAAAIGEGGEVGLAAATPNDHYVPIVSQINGDYCGPAMVQNLLWYWGPLTAVNYPWDSLNGNIYHDQPILATWDWLQTDYYGGTNWGAPRDTINWWTNWTVYVDAWFRHSDDQAGAASMIQTDVDWNWPVGENIRYFSGSYIPPGWVFGDYQHWDTIYFFDGSTIAIAQSYPSPGAPGTYYPYYSMDWNTAWKAINEGHGIIW